MELTAFTIEFSGRLAGFLEELTCSLIGAGRGVRGLGLNPKGG
jgi:hypothetical protein